MNFNVVISECSFCLFPDKEAAAKTIYRSLKHNGRLGITDIAIEKPLPISGQDILLKVACIADALSMNSYHEIFEQAGFKIESVTEEKEMVTKTIKSIKAKLFMFELAKGLKKIDIESMDVKQLKEGLKTVEKYITEGYGTYMMLIGNKL